MKVLVSGGGTAGHINPALAIIREIEQIWPECEILYIGTKQGLEAKLVLDAGYNMKFIDVSGFRRKLSFDTVKTAFRLLRAMRQSRKIIKEFAPDVAIGTGGYVCGPIIKCAAQCHIPTLIHEQNAFPGVTNKLLAKKVNVVAISFKEAKKYFTKAKRVELTGNPVRAELLTLDRPAARAKMGLSEVDKMVVCMGGSRGAERLNDAMVDLINNHHKGEYHLLFATGEVHYDSVMGRLKKPLPQGVEVVRYIYDSASAYASADLMICRSGAITVAELGVTGVPSILIPSPYVTANHQEYNARTLETVGAAKIVHESQLSAEDLHDTICRTLADKSLLENMREKALSVAIKDSAKRIGCLVKDIVG